MFVWLIPVHWYHGSIFNIQIYLVSQYYLIYALQK